MARLYTNENFPRPVAAELHRLGHDVLTSLDAGQANTAISDEMVLAFAAAGGRVLLTYNRRHFLLLHQHRSEAHAGIILCTVDPDHRAQARRIHAAISDSPDLTNQLIRINRPSVRPV